MEYIFVIAFIGFFVFALVYNWGNIVKSIKKAKANKLPKVKPQVEKKKAEIPLKVENFSRKEPPKVKPVEDKLEPVHNDEPFEIVSDEEEDDFEKFRREHPVFGYMEKQTLADEIKGLSPTLKALIITNALERKDDLF